MMLYRGTQDHDVQWSKVLRRGPGMHYPADVFVALTAVNQARAGYSYHTPGESRFW